MTIPFSIFWLNIGLTANMPINQGINSKFDEFVFLMNVFHTKYPKIFTKKIKKVRQC